MYQDFEYEFEIALEKYNTINCIAKHNRSRSGFYQFIMQAFKSKANLRRTFNLGADLRKSVEIDITELRDNKKRILDIFHFVQKLTEWTGNQWFVNSDTRPSSYRAEHENHFTITLAQNETDDYALFHLKQKVGLVGDGSAVPEMKIVKAIQKIFSKLNITGIDPLYADTVKQALSYLHLCSKRYIDTLTTEKIVSSTFIAEVFSIIFSTPKAKTHFIHTANPFDLLLASEYCSYHSCFSMSGAYSKSILEFVASDQVSMLLGTRSLDFPFYKVYRTWLFSKLSKTKKKIGVKAFVIGRQYGFAFNAGEVKNIATAILPATAELMPMRMNVRSPRGVYWDYPTFGMSESHTAFRPAMAKTVVCLKCTKEFLVQGRRKNMIISSLVCPSCVRMGPRPCVICVRSSNNCTSIVCETFDINIQDSFDQSLIQLSDSEANENVPLYLTCH